MESVRHRNIHLLRRGGGLRSGARLTKLAVLTSGLWRIRRHIEAATGATVVRRSLLSRPDFDAVGGWGCKPTSAKARALAERHRCAYVSLEDGWIRSVRPGPSEMPLSIVVDEIGTHYDASRPNRLESLVSAASSRTAGLSRARRAINLLREEAISKYNAAPMISHRRLGLASRPVGGRVLVVDQTIGDASISGGLAGASRFTEMLAAARTENPGAEILVKTHPEVSNGRKKGYLSKASGPGIRLLSDAINPWCLFDVVDRVYVVSSQLGFEALMADLPVTCFGVPYYAGWGLTDDRIGMSRRTARPSLEQLFHALYFDYARYVSRSGEVVTFEEAVDILLSERDQMLGSRTRVHTAGERVSYEPVAVAASA